MFKSIGITQYIARNALGAISYVLGLPIIAFGVLFMPTGRSYGFFGSGQPGDSIPIILIGAVPMVIGYYIFPICSRPFFWYLSRIIAIVSVVFIEWCTLDAFTRGYGIDHFLLFNSIVTATVILYSSISILKRLRDEYYI